MWQFKELKDDEPERNPRDPEFFGGLEASDKLVRENIQNALDARLTNNIPINVRFIFGETDCINDEYFTGLVSHAKSANIISNEKLPDRIPYLTIEDFNTKGLDGPLSRDEVGEIKGNYLNFWWGEGESDKGGKNAGRFGLGKTVYHGASKLSTFFGYTVRASDCKELLLGKALLRSHKHIDGKRYTYFAYYSEYDGKAIIDSIKLSEFKKTFAITRTNESGLSVIIPLLVEGISPQSIIRSAIIHYFFPIIAKDLTIEIRNAENKTFISNETLYDIARQQNWVDTPWENRNIESLLAFLGQCLAIGKQVK